MFCINIPIKCIANPELPSLCETEDDVYTGNLFPLFTKIYWSEKQVQLLLNTPMSTACAVNKQGLQRWEPDKGKERRFSWQFGCEFLKDLHLIYLLPELEPLTHIWKQSLLSDTIAVRQEHEQNDCQGARWTSVCPT